MTRRHEVWLARDDGTRLQILDRVESFGWNRVINGIGRCTITLPDDFDRSLFAIDRKILILRAPTDGLLRLENAYFIRRVVTSTNASALTRIILHGVDGNHLLQRRSIAFSAGTTEANKTDEIDDMMKEIVDENLGASAGNDPDGNDRSFNANFFSVDPDFSLGPSISKAFARRNVMDVLQDLSEAARTAGDQVYFAVVPVTETQFVFRTFLDQPGQDNRHPGGTNPITFSLNAGNIEAPILDDDFEDEENYVFAAGQGEAVGRDIQTAFDLPRINRSIWGRMEGFRDARHEPTSAGVTAEAQARLTKGRPVRKFDTSLLSVEGSEYGVHWDFGDRVTVEYLGNQFDGLIRAVNISVDNEGGENVEGFVEVTDVA